MKPCKDNGDHSEEPGVSYPPNTGYVTEGADTAWATWAASFQQSLEALLYCKHDEEVSSNNWHHASLVWSNSAVDENTQKFCYVHWTNRGRLLGRAINLDRFSRIIYALPAMSPVQSWSAPLSAVVVRDVGAAMHSVTAKFRETVNTNVVRLKDMLESAVGPSVNTLEPCFLCACVDGEITCCPICLLWWHRACSQRMIAECWERIRQDLGAQTQVLQWFCKRGCIDRVCGLCKLALQLALDT